MYDDSDASFSSPHYSSGTENPLQNDSSEEKPAPPSTTQVIDLVHTESVKSPGTQPSTIDSIVEPAIETQVAYLDHETPTRYLEDNVSQNPHVSPENNKRSWNPVSSGPVSNCSPLEYGLPRNMPAICASVVSLDVLSKMWRNVPSSWTLIRTFNVKEMMTNSINASLSWDTRCPHS